MIYCDKDILGIGLIVASIGSLVGIFLYGRKSEIQERKEKSKDILIR